MSITVQGQDIADTLINRYKGFLRDVSDRPVMGIVIVSENPVTASYVNKKRLIAQSIGIPFIECFLGEGISQQACEQRIADFTQTVDGLVVQLPLPKHIDTQKVLSLISPEQDVDCLNPHTANHQLVGPVAGAVIEICQQYEVDLADKRIVVIGQGRLVGKPVTRALTDMGHGVSVITDTTPAREKEHILQKADVIISGASKPGLVIASDIKPGVVLIDAGTSTSGGTIRGDIAPECATKASVYSPTPGGIGPITIAKLFENLLILQGIIPDSRE